MAYASNTDVAAEFKALSANGGFNSGTNPTDAQVDEWCTRASNFMDSKIAGKYAVPITGTNSLSLMKEICVWLVATRVSKVTGLQTGDNKVSGNAGKVDYDKKAMDTLVEIQSGKMKLSDAPLATSTDGAESYTNDNASDLQPPTFTRAGKNW